MGAWSSPTTARRRCRPTARAARSVRHRTDRRTSRCESEGMYRSDSDLTNVTQLPLIDDEPTLPDSMAGAEPRRSPEDGTAGLADHGPWRHHLVGLLNGALATEVVCAL